MQVVETGHIVIDPDILGGKPHISGHRIAVSHIAVWATRHGMSPAQIAEEFHLTLGEVYAALAYYYDHQEEMDQAIIDAAKRAEEMARRYPQGWSPEADTGEHS
jgi:uncharacterized protein (DUF433 family)